MAKKQDEITNVEEIKEINEITFESSYKNLIIAGTSIQF